MFKQTITVISRAYSAILFLDSPVIGFAILAATFIHPNIALSGLVAALLAFFVAKLFEFPHFKSGIHIYNALLVGLSLGAFYDLNIYVITLILIGSLLTVFLTAALVDAFRRNGLPVFSLPFILVASVTAVVAQQYSILKNFTDYSDYAIQWFNPEINQFFNSLGATFFTTQPLMGVVVFAGILWYSRYMAMLAVTGYIAGYLVINLLSYDPHPYLISWTGFNFVLTAIALGGIYTIPGVAGFLTALLGVVFTALLVLASKDLLFIHGLPVLALPFVATTLIFLLALRTRVSVSAPWLSPMPALPEVNYERARLARVRNGEINSVPLLIPFFGQWRIYQGFNGAHTHKPPWQHALDFYITEDDKSFVNEGKDLRDFYCYGLPVLSPAHGEVVRLYDKLADNRPGDVDVKNNWGNFVLIRLDSGLHVILAHLKQYSVRIKEGERVVPGDELGACGNSGRSPQPHIHLQVQKTAELGSPTHPFHLSSFMHHKENKVSQYLVVGRPQLGDLIEATAIDERLATQLHLPVGRQFTYQVDGDNIKDKVTRQLQVELTLLGQFRLVSDTGASAAFEEVNGVLAFYDRQGPADIFLDMWLLANGLTPLTESAHQWRDAPSVQLLPLNYLQRIIIKLFRPLGCGLDSHYKRHWEEKYDMWTQRGQHEFKMGSVIWRAETRSDIDPVLGCRELNLSSEKGKCHAILKETGLASDEGIPGWS